MSTYGLPTGRPIGRANSRPSVGRKSTGSAQPACVASIISTRRGLGPSRLGRSKQSSTTRRPASGGSHPDPGLMAHQTDHQRRCVPSKEPSCGTHAVADGLADTSAGLPAERLNGVPRSEGLRESGVDGEDDADLGGRGVVQADQDQRQRWLRKRSAVPNSSAVEGTTGRFTASEPAVEG